jgi:hypothetical protein
MGKGTHTGESSDPQNRRMLSPSQFIQNLANACEGLYTLPASMKDVVSFDVGLLKWDPLINPWFPCISAEGAEGRQNVNVKPRSQ